MFSTLPMRISLSEMLFLALLLAVAAMRIFELRISRKHQRDMTARGACKVKDPNFRWMAMFHALVLIAAAAEVLFLHRPFIPALAFPMIALFIFANIVRWWVIRTLGEHWNVQVMDSTRLGVITTGPFRYVRHPNYAAVFVEMIALPLIHTAWITALAGAIAHAIVLTLRLSTEERVLFADPDYAAAMSSKPRFLPGLF
jgi:methyltransferase